MSSTLLRALVQVYMRIQVFSLSSMWIEVDMFKLLPLYLFIIFLKQTITTLLRALIRAFYLFFPKLLPLQRIIQGIKSQ